MSKNKKTLSLDDLKKLTIDENGIKEKSPEEIAKLEQEEKRKTAKSPEDYYSKKKQSITFTKEHITHIKQDRVAVSPYNFIPLNDNPIPAEFDSANFQSMESFSVVLSSADYK